MYSMSHRTVPGSKGHSWYLQVGIKYEDDTDSKTTMLLGLQALMEILPDAINGFALQPLDENSGLPPLTSNKHEDGFPNSAVLAFQYFHVKDKRNRSASSQAAAPLSQPLPHRFDNEEDFRPSMQMYRVIRVTGNGNIKEACDALVWDMVDSGLTIRWKEHQSADSSAQVLLMNVPPIHDRAGVEQEIIWHLAEIEKGLMKKGKLPEAYIRVPLPEIKVSWRQKKQGRGKNKAEKDLLLNKLPAFQENGHLVCTVEAWEGSWPRMGPLWEAFHKMGLCRRALCQSCLLVVMFNGQATDSDHVTMQRLRRINVVHAYMTSHVVLPDIACVHKRVEIEMEDGSKPKHKFTDLCREVRWIQSTILSDDGIFKPLFD
jgi:hypothetical protein